MALSHPQRKKPKPVANVRRDGRVECPTCKLWVRADLDENMVHEHGHDSDGRMCSGSFVQFARKYPRPPGKEKRERVAEIIARHQVADAETLCAKRARRDAKLTQSQRTALRKQAEEAVDSKMEFQRSLDLAKINTYDPDFHGRTVSGGLPGLGKRGS